MFVENSILTNINTGKITALLKSKNIKQEDGDKGMAYHLWLGKLINEEKIAQEDINECLYKELMFGRRRLIRFYELKNIRKIKHIADWKDFFHKFNYESMNFNNILETHLTHDEKYKIAAIKSVSNDSHVLTSVDILFVYRMEMKAELNNGNTDTYSYIPVNFNLLTKTMTIKVWNRDGAYENNGSADQLDKIYSVLTSGLEFETKPITINPQKVLYEMSKSLFDEFFKSLPNIAEIETKKDSLNDIVNSMLDGITLENSIVENGNISMNPEVINVKEEMYKLLQQVALYDYLKDNTLEKLLQNTDEVIARIKFNDRDNLSASLIGERGVKCIFDTKTFMCIRNSLDLVESIVSIAIAFNRDRGKMTVKYDASNSQYLNIHILNDRYYSEEDYKIIWELYRKYESDDTTKINNVCVEDNTQAM